MARLRVGVVGCGTVAQIMWLPNLPSTMIASRSPTAVTGGRTSPSCKKLSLLPLRKAWAERPRDENRTLYRLFVLTNRLN